MGHQMQFFGHISQRQHYQRLVAPAATTAADTAATSSAQGTFTKCRQKPNLPIRSVVVAAATRFCVPHVAGAAAAATAAIADIHVQLIAVRRISWQRVFCRRVDASSSGRHGNISRLPTTTATTTTTGMLSGAKCC